MRYTVIWKPTAANHLADIWTSFPDRRAVTQAVEEIDTLLSREDAGERGESRYPQDDPPTNPTRVLMIPPLLVIFRVIDPDKVVEVATVRCYRLK